MVAVSQITNDMTAPAIDPNVPPAATCTVEPLHRFSLLFSHDKDVELARAVYALHAFELDV
jgi:hypothetical protein